MRYINKKRGCLLGAVVALTGIGALMFMVCTINPIQTGQGYLINLTVDDKTHTEATFSGEQITAFITFHDSIPNDIAWHTGLGQKYVLPYTKKDKELKAKLFWLSKPVKKDSATGKFYDSIYVSIGGEQNRSNYARIYVTNLAPVIDSVKVGATGYLTTDTIRYSVKTSDTLKVILIRIIAHDLDKNTITGDWGLQNARVVPVKATLNAQYTIPLFNCLDTITADVSDGQGGSDKRTIIIKTQKNANRAPIIDSVSAKDTLFTAASDVYYYSSAMLDSVKFTMSAHDSDVFDALTYQWSNKNLKQTTLRSTGASASLTWACTAAVCKEAATALTVMDTVSVIVRDNDSAVAQKSIVIVKGKIGPNKPPVLDSLMVSDTLLKGLWSQATIKASVRDTVKFKMYSHDPDSVDTIHLSISAQDTQRLKKSGDTAAIYVCGDSLFRDTIKLRLYDLHMGVVDRKVVVDISNRFPIIDSVRIVDTTAKATDSSFVKIATLKDSILVRVFAHDPDKGDTIKSLRWFSSDTANDTVKFKKIVGTQAVYICKDSVYLDTCFIQVSDKKQKTTRKKIIFNVSNHSPIIDSVQFGDTLVVFPDSMVIRSFSVRDTALFRLFAHDPDVGDSLTVRWKVSDTSKNTLRLKNISDTSCKYICKDSLYKDTCIVSIIDKNKKMVSQKMSVNVNNRYPLIDSIKCADTLFKAKDSVYFKKAKGSDSLTIKLFARDLDVADTVSDTLVSSSGISIVKLLKLQYKYICPDSTFVDTLWAGVRDRKTKTTTKKIVIGITKK